MSKMLPYPGRYESHGSWMRRCDEWERDRNQWRREQAARHTNWGGYHYYTTENFDTPVIQKIENEEFLVIKRGYGYRSSYFIENFAIKHGLSFKRFNGNGLKGICERIDGIAYKDSKLDEIYSCDDH